MLLRPLLLCLVPCYLLSAAPSGAVRDIRPPERPAPVITDSGRALPGRKEMERLAREQPLDFIRACLLYYKRQVKGYRLTMSKQERIAGQLEPAEVMEVAFREQPFSVFLKWDKGARKAERALYVEGDNDDKLLVLPARGWALAARLAGRLKNDLVVVDPEGKDALESGRFTIKQFGMFNGLDRLLGDWEAAQQKNALHVEYLGRQGVEPAGGRRCHVLRRSHFQKPERDGVTEQTVYIDAETWLQVGSVANGEAGLIGAYFYRNIQINPDFPPNQFMPAAVKK